VDALAEAVALVKAGKAPRIAQNEANATYEPPCEGAHARIDWKKPSVEVYNLIRGCDPQPGAYGMAAGKKLSMYATTHLPGHSAAVQSRPGEILNVTEEGILVAGQGGALLLRKVRPEGGKKTDGAAYARSAGLAKGAILS
jgi:methionyl-tRNA formyltransferase